MPPSSGLRFGILDLLLDHAADRGLAEAVLLGALERLVEVRPRRPLRAGAGERVAGAAVLDEHLLAGDEVGVGAAAVATARGEQRHGQESGQDETAALHGAELYPSGQRQVVKVSCRCRGDHRPRHAVPGVALARDLDERLARRLAQALRRLQPADEALGEAADVARSGSRATAAAASGTARASVRVTSASPEWSDDTGSAPQAAASAATIPNASGKVLGHDLGLGERQQRRQLGVLEAPGQHDAVREPARGLQVRARRSCRGTRADGAAAPADRPRPRGPPAASARTASRSPAASAASSRSSPSR